MVQLLDPLPAAAADTGSNHGGLYALHDGGKRHDHSADNDIVDSNAIVAVGLPAVESEAINALSEIVYPGKSACVNVRHNDRFCEIDAHPGGSLGSYECSPLRERSKHNRGAQSNHKSRSVLKYYASVSDITETSPDDEQIVNPATKDTPHSATVTS